NAVHGVEIACSVVIPDDAAVTSVVGPQMPVDRSGEDDARNDADGGRLSTRASERALARKRRRWRVPDPFTTAQPDRVQSACLFTEHIGARHIHDSLVGGGAPLAAAERTGPA